MGAPGFDVIVCGSLHLDIVLYAPSLPRPDETVVGRRWTQQCGGKGGNQAIRAARAGARTAMIGRVGADDFGTRLSRNLIDSGVDASAVTVDPAAGSGMSAAIVRDDGEYGAVIVSGSNLGIEPASIPAHWRALGGARTLILQNEAPQAVNIAAARAARGAGAQVILNAAPARAMPPALLELVDVLVVNRIEATMLSGTDVAGKDEAFAALTRLRSRARAIVITLGGDGLVVLTAERDAKWIPPKKVKAISAHGAGDCFVGTMAAHIAHGDPLLSAAAAANRAAADFVGGRI